MDDGSKDVAESISMLGMQTSQGVGTVIATPHFYANDETVSAFLKRRAEAYEALKEQLGDQGPNILLGAEVRYYQGISRLEGLKELAIEGSKLLLLEMPMSVWTETMVRELVELAGKNRVRIVLAHVERYIKLQKRSVWDRIVDSGILLQVNASFVTSLASRRKALALLQDGVVQFLGSDCHNLTTRPPVLGQAAEVIRKKLGDDFLNQMQQYGYSLLTATIQ
jgi:protein-tyrosine phosphatase